MRFSVSAKIRGGRTADYTIPSAVRCSLDTRFPSGCFARDLAQDVRQDAAVPVVLDLDRRVDSQQNRHPLFRSILALDDEHDVLLRFDLCVEAEDVELFVALQPEGLRALVALELQRQHTHADQIRAMNALETPRDDGLYAEQARAFRGPVAR